MKSKSLISTKKDFNWDTTNGDYIDSVDEIFHSNAMPDAECLYRKYIYIYILLPYLSTNIAAVCVISQIKIHSTLPFYVFFHHIKL